jgi:hypothetical protein
MVMGRWDGDWDGELACGKRFAGIIRSSGGLDSFFLSLSQHDTFCPSPSLVKRGIQTYTKGSVKYEQHS